MDLKASSQSIEELLTSDKAVASLLTHFRGSGSGLSSARCP